ncbi:PAS domain-containing protein [Sphingobium sp.]|uniref:response regulator transcription factor n=1 Tax=Sphingobium sp. TaxID=1912891 RepID=UPI003BB5C2B4
MSLSTMITDSDVAAVLSNPRLPDNPIVECNSAFLTLTGYSRDEIIGHNCRFLAGPDTDNAQTDAIRASVRERRPALIELLNYRKDGTPFRNAVMIAPIFGDDGALEYFLGSQMAVAGPETQRECRAADARARIGALTARQRAVLVAMASGKLNKQIAWDLGLTERTVKMHRAAMLKALNARSGAEGIRLAIEAGY